MNTTTLDLWCAENGIAPTFIKMDIEGAEQRAIIGAQHVIQAYMPRLAISVYHSLEDMWVIPQLLRRICPAYKFWFRKNAEYGESVLYAAAE